MAMLSFKWLFTLLLITHSFSSMTFVHHEKGEQSVSKYHPFYVSVTEINHNAKEQSIEVSCKIFADDMEEVLKKNYKVAVDLSNTKQQAQTDKLIADYISKHLTFSTDGKPVKLQYVGFEKESESVYCYFEIAGTPVLKKLEVTNSILQDLTDQQINIMHVVVNGNRKSYKLDFPHKQASFQF
jgi:hypothetical protein